MTKSENKNMRKNLKAKRKICKKELKRTLDAIVLIEYEISCGRWLPEDLVYLGELETLESRLYGKIRDYDRKLAALRGKGKHCRI